jgi:uncharacterized protein with PIN domain
MSEGFETNWSELQQQVNSYMIQWRRDHPKATLKEIELTLNAQMAALQAKMLEQLALASAATASNSTADPPLCPNCGGAVQKRGKQTRQVITSHDQTVELERTYLYCPSCQSGFFPPRP